MLVFLFVLPEYQQANELQLTLSDKQAQYNGQSLYYATIGSLAGNIKQRKEALEKIDSSLPTDFSVAPLVYFFQQKSAETGSTVKSIVFLDGKSTGIEKQVRTVSFSINLVGTYQSLKSFLMALEKSSRIFEVPTISFSSVREQSINPSLQNQSNQTYNFRLEVKTYTY